MGFSLKQKSILNKIEEGERLEPLSMLLLKSSLWLLPSIAISSDRACIIINFEWGVSMRNSFSKEIFMDIYQCKHEYVCGIDLHSKMLYACIVDRALNVLVHEPIANKDTRKFLKILKPYKGKIVIAAEACFPYYWVADFAAENNFDFQLGHPLYMRFIHGTKSKDDPVDSNKISCLTMKNYLPMAHTCSKEIRHLRDLMRRRLFFVHESSGFQTHVKIQAYQSNFQILSKEFDSSESINEIPLAFENEDQRYSVAMNIRTISHFSKEIKAVIKYIRKRMKVINNEDFTLLSSIRGIGKIIALTILLEIDTINRFPDVGHFVSYSRLVKCSHESAGKKLGFGNTKIGNQYLRYAFGEAAVHMAKNNPRVKEWLENFAKRKGKGKAMGALAHKIARAVFHILKTKEKFDLDKFLSNP
jgi:hypothetical protein